MMRSRMVTRAAVLLWAGLLVAPGALVQGQATIPPAVVSSADPTSSRPQIQKFIADQIAELAKPDAAARAAARDALVNAVTTGTPSAGFVDLYCVELSQQIAKLFSGSALETRLNAAIVLSRVAAVDRTGQTVPAVVAALGDDQQPVALWGLKAAARLLPNVLANPALSKGSPLLAKVNEVAAKHLNWLAIVEAYDALTFTSHSTQADLLLTQISKANWQAMVPQVAPMLLDLWSARLKTYAAGEAVEPAAEIIPASFFSGERTWQVLKPDQQQRVMQLLSDQLGMAAQLAAQKPTERDAYIRVLQITASALTVISTQTAGGKPLEEAARPVRTIQAATAANVIQNLADAVLPAIKKVPAFANTAPPPKVAATP